MENVMATDVILHAFDWPYQRVAEQASAISAGGYKSVLVSPPMKSLTSAQGTQWWQRYQPQDYRVIDNQLGNTQDFKHMIAALEKHGISVYADVVFNHMANESSLRLDLQYPSAADMADYEARADYYQSQRLYGDLSQPLFTEQDFVEAFGIKDWQDKWQVQNGRITGGATDPGLPTLRAHHHVIVQQQEYLKALKALGVRGFRIDAAKHMSIEHLKNVWTETITRDTHIFGEIITDGGATRAEYDIFLEPYLAETRLGAYDFPLFQTMFDALDEGGSLTSLVDPYCFGQALAKYRAVTFAITHDIPNNDVFENLVMDEALEQLAYTYILGRDGGVPLIYTDLNTSGINNHVGQPRWVDAWKDPAMLARIRFHNQMHGKIMTVLEANDDLLVLAREEAGLVIINKSTRGQRVDIAQSGTLKDLLSDTLYTAVQGKLSLDVAPVSSMMLVVQES